MSKLEEVAEKYVSNLPTYSCPSCNGQSDYALEEIFKAGASYQAEQSKVLIEALEFYTQMRQDHEKMKGGVRYEFYPNHDVALNALENYRESK